MSRNTLRTLYGLASVTLFCFVLPMAIYFRSLLNKEVAIVAVIGLLIVLVAISWTIYHRQKKALGKQTWNSWAKSGYDRYKC